VCVTCSRHKYAPEISTAGKRFVYTLLTETSPMIANTASVSTDAWENA